MTDSSPKTSCLGVGVGFGVGFFVGIGVGVELGVGVATTVGLEVGVGVELGVGVGHGLICAPILVNPLVGDVNFSITFPLSTLPAD